MMNIAGRIEDFSIVDIIQFIHLSGKDGVLHFKRQSGAPASLFFREGQIVRAEHQGMPNLGDLLLAQGKISRSQLQQALARQKEGGKELRLGRALQELGFVDADMVREALLRQIESVIGSLIAWHEGSFEFEIREGEKLDDISVSMGDLVLPSQVNTEYLLLEAMRKHDEAQRAVAKPAAASAGTLAEGGWPVVLCQGDGVDIASFLKRLENPGFSLHLLPEIGKVPRLVQDLVQQRADPLVIISLPGGSEAAAVHELLQLLLQVSPRLSVILLPSGRLTAAQIFGYYEQGATAILPLPQPTCSPEELARFQAALQNCAKRMVQTKRKQCALGRDPKNLSCNFLRLKPMLIESGRLGKDDISSQFLRLLSYYLQRAILFLPDHNILRGIGGFGKTTGQASVHQEAKQLRLPLLPDALPARLIQSRHSHCGPLPDEDWMKVLYQKIGAPLNKQTLLMPMCGLSTVMCLVYADNGTENQPMPPLELLEIAADQTGMILENSYMRKQLARKEAARTAPKEGQGKIC